MAASGSRLPTVPPIRYAVRCQVPAISMSTSTGTRVGFKDKLFPGSRDRVPTFGACIVTKDRVYEVGNLLHCLLETIR